MKTKWLAILLPLFAAGYLFAFAAPPVYPGAKLDDDMNQGLKKAGQNMTAYNTSDSYEKVCAFYQRKGGELRRGNPDSSKEKQAIFQFKESYYVTVLWKEDSKSHGTTILIGRTGRPGA